MTRLVRQNGEKGKKKKYGKEISSDVEQSNFARGCVTTEIINWSYFGHMGLGLSNLGQEEIAPIINKKKDRAEFRRLLIWIEWHWALNSWARQIINRRVWGTLNLNWMTLSVKFLCEANYKWKRSYSGHEFKFRENETLRRKHNNLRKKKRVEFERPWISFICVNFTWHNLNSLSSNLTRFLLHTY